ncbi:NUMOD4 motif-containing HNH endonuclease [Bacillus sp. Bva_UNVM-123]|uniref:NUMOD4 domain-containing protein n=1 Tax=Bacillus sp. Bva_UNVM-123 TaxID=2829798 RepID=UPI00391F0A2A
MKEIWKDVVGYEGIYIVSNLGRMKSLERKVRNNLNGGLRTIKESYLNTYTKENKYKKVGLQGKTFRVHRIVAEAFLKNPKGLPEVNHINGKKNDNRVINLEWVSSRDNSIHSYDNGLNHSGEKHPNSTMTNSQVIEIKKRTANKDRLVDISRDMKVSIKAVEFINQGRTWKRVVQ